MEAGVGLLPDKMGIDGFPTIYDNALTGTEGVDDGQKISPLGDLFGGRPFF